MQRNAARLIVITVIVGLALLGCNLPKGTDAPDVSGTIVAATLSALETSAALALTQTAPIGAETSTPAAASPTTAPAVTPVQQGPLVTIDSLCWVGPGNQYEVVSAIRTGTHVELLGRGTIAGWYIVRNPIYHDPCWVQATSLQIDPAFDLTGLPYFSPPPTPTPTPTNTPTNTKTPTPSPTNTP
jgi:hypothetical protein